MDDDGGPGCASGDPLDLLPLALSRPRAAVERARAVLARDPGPAEASIARQALGIVLREFGDVAAAVTELRVALRLARSSGSAGRETDVLASLGIALILAGRTEVGRATMQTAADRAVGAQRGRIVFLRGGTLLILGAHQEAMRDLNRAVTVLRDAGDSLWLARAYTERAFTSLAIGATARAARDLQRAEQLFAATGQELESADSVVHRGVLALRMGDLPAALASFDEAALRFEKLEVADADLVVHRSAALRAAGLPDEAMLEAVEAVERLKRVGGQYTKRAELMLNVATSALAAGRPAPALTHARQAAVQFARQRRTWWHAHARLVELRAGFAVGPASARLLAAAEQCAADLAALSSPETPTARLLAGRVALALGRTDIADAHLAAVARGRTRGPALARTEGWLAEALRRDAAGDAARVRHACRRGLDVLDEHRSALGSSELHAQATAHGAELARLGQRQALRSGRSRPLLAWSERWRASALTVPPVRPPDDRQLQADLSAMRDVASRLAAARARGLATMALHREQLRLERAVRARALRTGRDGGYGRARLDVGALLDELGDERMVELVDMDGDLYALVCGGGRVRRHSAGTTAEAAREVEKARFWLTRLAHGVSTAEPSEIAATLAGIGARCEELLLGAAARDLGDGPVTIVPPGRLHAVPWSVLPVLAGRPVAVVPSAAVWLGVRRRDPVARGPVVLVRGPGLGSGGAEIPELAALYDGPTVLGGGTATAARVLDALDGAGLAHIAAHGAFRADSPLFSALRLDDGPLTVYDLERLRRAPQRVVLSSCDSALVTVAGADELIGLASSLMPLGTAAIVASVVPVSDRQVAPLMVALHRHLRAGLTMADALDRARVATGSDPAGLATGWSFLALGPG